MIPNNSTPKNIQDVMNAGKLVDLLWKLGVGRPFSNIRQYYWREFGAGRASDFNALTVHTNRAFTMDDGTTLVKK